MALNLRNAPATGRQAIFLGSTEPRAARPELDAALNACGFECIIDRHISGGEDWKQRLGNCDQRG
jgi:hypothetical protein